MDAPNGTAGAFIPEQLTIFNNLTHLEHALDQFIGLIGIECRALAERTNLLNRANQYFSLLDLITRLFDDHVVNIGESIRLSVPPEQVFSAMAVVEQLYTSRLRSLLQPRLELQWLFVSYNAYVKEDFNAFTLAIAKYHGEDHCHFRNMPTLTPNKENDELQPEILAKIEQLRLSYQSLVRSATVLCGAAQNVRKLCSQFVIDPNEVICCDLINVKQISKELLIRYGLFYSVHPPASVRIASAWECFQLRLQLWIPEEFLSASVDALLQAAPYISVVNESLAQNLYDKLSAGTPLSSATDNMTSIFPQIQAFGKDPTRTARSGPVPFVQLPRPLGFRQMNRGTPNGFAETEYQCLGITQAARERHKSARQGSCRSSSATVPYYFVVGLPIMVLSDWAQRLVLQHNNEQRDCFFFAMEDWFAQPDERPLEKLIAIVPDLIRSLLPAEQRDKVRRLDECELDELRCVFVQKLNRIKHADTTNVALEQFAPLTATEKTSSLNSQCSSFDFVFKLARLLSENAIVRIIFNSRAMGHFLRADKRSEFLQHDLSGQHFGLFFCAEMSGAFYLTLSTNEHALEKLANGELLAKIVEKTNGRTPMCLGVPCSLQQWQLKLRELQQRSQKRAHEGPPGADGSSTVATANAAWKVTVLVTQAEVAKVTGFTVIDGKATKQKLAFTRYDVVDVGGIDANQECGGYAACDMTSMFQPPLTTTVLVNPFGVLKAELPTEESCIQVSASAGPSQVQNMFRTDSTPSPMSPPQIPRRQSLSGARYCQGEVAQMPHAASAVTIRSPFYEPGPSGLKYRSPSESAAQWSQPAPAPMQHQLNGPWSTGAPWYGASTEEETKPGCSQSLPPITHVLQYQHPVQCPPQGGLVCISGNEAQSSLSAFEGPVVEASEQQARKRIAHERNLPNGFQVAPGARLPERIHATTDRERSAANHQLNAAGTHPSATLVQYGAEVPQDFFAGWMQPPQAFSPE